jgi:hypothetical protein
MESEYPNAVGKARACHHETRSREAQLLSNFDEASSNIIPSQREFAEKNGISRTTLQYWLSRRDKIDASQAVVKFFESPDGLAFLHQLVIALQFTMCIIGNCGIRVVCLFLELSMLDRFVAPSYGVQQVAVEKMTDKINEFGQEEQQKLAQNMTPKTITVCEDETFHPEICLVAIEPVSDYILLEEYAAGRDATTWNEKMETALSGMRVEVIQSTSDEGKGIVSHVKEGLGAHHSPDLFHVQHELNKATSVSLSAQLRRSQETYESAAKQTEKEMKVKAAYESRKEMAASHGNLAELEDRIKTAKLQEDLAFEATIAARERKETVSAAIRKISQVYHPIDLESGRFQDAETVCHKLTELFRIIEKTAVESSLSINCLKRIEKAKRVLPQMIATIVFVHQLLRAKIDALSLAPELEAIVYQHWLPGVYIERVAAQSKTADQREILREMATDLLEPVNERFGPLKSIAQEDWAIIESVVKECAMLFQRSSSCVEGRNGQLSLRHHSWHQIRPKKLRALTVVHNFFITRSDGSTAAQRFFGQQAGDLFAYLLQELDVPRRPARRRSRRVATFH